MNFFKVIFFFIFPIFLFGNVDLNIEEKEWIKQNPIVKVGVDANWPPFDFVDSSKKHKGISSDYLKYISKQTGLKFEFYGEKWNKVMEKIQAKELDILACAALTNDREEYLHFTSAYLNVDIVVVGKKDTKIDSFEEISDFKVALPKGNFIHEQLEKEFPNIEFVFVTSNEEALELVSFGKADLYIGNLPVVSYFVDKNHLTNLKILFKTPYDKARLSIAVLKEKRVLYSILEKTLTSIPENIKDEIYQNWVSIDYEIEVDYSLLWKIIISFLVVISIFIYWNRKLKNEITQKELAKKELEESRNFIKAMMNSQTNIVIATNGEEIQVANRAFLNFTGFTSLKKFKEKFDCICDLFDGSNPSSYLIPVKNEIKWIDEVLNNPDKLHKAMIYKNEKKHIFKVTAAYVSKENETKTAVFTDITELITLSEMLELAKDEALNATKAKSEFLANMSHEIRTPMNSVIGFTDLLDKEITNPIQKDYLSSIKKGGKALLRIINDILDLSKIEAGKMQIKNESLNPKNLFFEIESIFDSKIVSKNLNFIMEIDETIPEYIIIDGVRLRQVLFNLIGNAIKFTEKGFIKLKVENPYKNDEKSKIDLIFSIEDSGIGIDKKEQELIFKAFEQQTNQSVQKYGGTGLGLAICSKLVKIMNGEIQIESEKTKGSKFTVILRDIPVSSVSTTPICQKLDFTNVSFKESTILVVDDVLENRKLVEASLKDFDFELIMAENGKEALDKLKRFKVDLVLMDLRMPVMNGYEATQKIKEDKELKNIPVIALTASVMGKDLEKVEEFGFDAYLRKPVIVDDLIEQISSFISYEIEKNETITLNKKDEIISIEVFEKCLDFLNKNMRKDWLEVKDSGDFIQIEEFVNTLYKESKEFKITILIEYCEDLLRNIESFDIEKVDFLINSYEKIIKKIEVLKADDGK